VGRAPPRDNKEGEQPTGVGAPVLGEPPTEAKGAEAARGGDSTAPLALLYGNSGLEACAVLTGTMAAMKNSQQTSHLVLRGVGRLQIASSRWSTRRWPTWSRRRVLPRGRMKIRAYSVRSRGRCGPKVATFFCE
jgi:hypothetical protein